LDLTQRVRDYPLQGSLLLFPIHSTFAPYVLAGVGWYTHVVDTLDTGKVMESTSTRKMGWHGGFGAEMKMGKHAGVHADYRYTMVHFGDGTGSASVTGGKAVAGTNAGTTGLASRLLPSYDGSMWTAGVTFYFAPLYHPAFKIIAPVRKKLAERKQRTIFNILGPLVNPAQPTHQLVGVFDQPLVAKFAEVLRLLGLKHALIVHGDGLDELSTMGVNTVGEVWHGRVELTERDFRVPPTLWRGMPVKLAELAGGDPVTNAGIVHDILAGEDRGPKRDIVLLNAAAALVVAEVADSFEQGWTRAAELIDSGGAMEKLNRFVATSNRA